MHDASLERARRKDYDRGYRFAKNEPVVELVAGALARCGHEVRYYGLSGGAADANVFNERGLRCVNLTHGVYDFHSPNERVAVADLEAMVDVTVALVEDARPSSIWYPAVAVRHAPRRWSTRVGDVSNELNRHASLEAHAMRNQLILLSTAFILLGGVIFTAPAAGGQTGAAEEQRSFVVAMHEIQAAAWFMTGSSPSAACTKRRRCELER